ncbi:hydroxymethylbilane synthase [Sporothrix schenckii 1099-18]|uniref:Porphobilinogen deaminase n=2 Tax=Sporothrix schenckii TaxID=29908 RepID=U7Q2Y2_SPOS1|nr:hydroxymethylbilane synthase [Sporothrix schenckii 1099-18]ERT01365.1 porphobilinogen deaminase [Sporothrix schenckii ATCC 58251]KJR88548.1 hydroxymethylbilane synthase [Sporothrix schenckii 1099-18]
MASSAPTTVRVGTRSSKLAVRQAETVVAALEAANPGVNFVIDARETAGDRDKVTPLPNLGKGLWTSEFEARLVAGDLDLVVHCAKDMPTALPAGCILGAILDREDPRDAVIFPVGSQYTEIGQLPAGSVVGTSSVRRSAQLKRRYPGLSFLDLRGNIDTRLRKLDDSVNPNRPADAPRYDCIILAAAGLKRMKFDGRISQYLQDSTSGTLYAVGQGALALEIREGDAQTQKLLDPILHKPTTLECMAERAVMRALEGGCSVPIGVECQWSGDDKSDLELKATVVSLDGRQAVNSAAKRRVTTVEEADALGLHVASTMVQMGAQAILDEINKNRVPPPAVVPAPTA